MFPRDVRENSNSRLLNTKSAHRIHTTTTNGGAQLSGALPIFGFNVQTRELIVVELVLDIMLHWLVDFREVTACYVVCIKIWIKKFGLSLVLGTIYALKL